MVMKKKSVNKMRGGGMMKKRGGGMMEKMMGGGMMQDKRNKTAMGMMGMKHGGLHKKK